MKIKKVKEQLIYKEQIKKAQDILIENMMNIQPYMLGIVGKEHIQKVGYILFSGRVISYLLDLQSNIYMPTYQFNKRYYVGKCFDMRYLSFLELIKYKKYDVNFKKVSNIRFIYKYIKYIIRENINLVIYKLDRNTERGIKRYKRFLSKCIQTWN